MWMSLIPSVEDLKKNIDLPQEGESCQQMALGLQLQLFSGFPACWSTLQIIDFLSLCNHISLTYHKYWLSYWFCFSGNTSIYHVPGIILNTWGLWGIKGAKTPALLELMIMACAWSQRLESSTFAKSKERIGPWLPLGITSKPLEYPAE